MSADRPVISPCNAVSTPKRRGALVVLLAAGTVTGLTTDLAKLASDEGVGAFSYLAWSTFIAAGLLVADGARRRGFPHLTRATARYFAVASLITIEIPRFILIAAVPHVGAGFVSISIAFPPLYTYVVAVVLGMERLDGRRVGGVALALVGSLTIAALELTRPDSSASWLGLTLIAPVFLAAGNIYRTRKWPTGARPEHLAPGLVVAASLILAMTALAPGTSLATPTSGEALALIAAQGVLIAVLYRLLFVLQQRGGPVLLSLMGSVAAVAGTGIAVGVLGEHAPAGLLPGGTAIAVGVALVTSRQRQAIPSPQHRASSQRSAGVQRRDRPDAGAEDLGERHQEVSAA